MAWAPDYATVAELKAYTRIADDADDAQIALAITAASREIDKACNRQFGTVSSATDRWYTARYDRSLRKYVCEIDDLQSMAGFAIAYGTSEDAITDYTLTPRNSASLGRPWTSLTLNSGGGTTRDGVKVTAKWGWSSVPDTIKNATLMQASRTLARRDSPYGVAGSPEAGTEVRLLAKLDPDVKLMVGAYYRWWVAV